MKNMLLFLYYYHVSVQAYGNSSSCLCPHDYRGCRSTKITLKSADVLCLIKVLRTLSVSCIHNLKFLTSCGNIGWSAIKVGSRTQWHGVCRIFGKAKRGKMSNLSPFHSLYAFNVTGWARREPGIFFFFNQELHMLVRYPTQALSFPHVSITLTHKPHTYSKSKDLHN